MDQEFKKKLNMLAYLAKQDGDFENAEKEVVDSIVAEMAYHAKTTSMSEDMKPLSDLDNMGDKEEVVYLTLKLIQADGIITDEELRFSRELVTKLSYNPDVINYYANQKLPSPIIFESEMKNWLRD